MKSECQENSQQKLPDITIIIATKPGGKCEEVLNSIKNIKYPLERIEIIISEGKNPSKQRNEAIKQSSGDFLFFFDDDVIIEENTIIELLKCYNEDTIALAGGPNLTPKSNSSLQKCFGIALSNFFGSAQVRYRYKSIGKKKYATEYDLILCNLSGRKEILMKNLFDESLWPNEENELINRVIARKHKAIYNPDAVVFHSRREDVLSFIRQVFNYGKSRTKHILKKYRMSNVIFLIPSIFLIYLFLILVYIISPIYIRHIGRFTFLPLIAYISISILTSLNIAFVNKNINLVIQMPFIFLIIHISYGAGMIFSLFEPKIKKSSSIKLRRLRIKKTK